MTARMPGSLSEFGLIVIVMLGIVTAVALGAGIALTAIKYLLSDGMWHSLIRGAPWAIGGGLVGFVLGVYWLEREIDHD